MGQYSKVGPEELVDGSAPGFLLSKGKYEKITFPGASMTALVGINNSGRIAGSYGDGAGGGAGFVRSRSGDFTLIESPNETWVCCAYGINDRGQLVGASVAPVEATAAARERLPADRARSESLVSNARADHGDRIGGLARRRPPASTRIPAHARRMPAFVLDKGGFTVFDAPEVAANESPSPSGSP